MIEVKPNLERFTLPLVHNSDLRGVLWEKRKVIRGLMIGGIVELMMNGFEAISAECDRAPFRIGAGGREWIHLLTSRVVPDPSL